MASSRKCCDDKADEVFRGDNHPCAVIIVRNHVHQVRVAGLGCATVTEESLLNLITVNGKGLCDYLRRNAR